MEQTGIENLKKAIKFGVSLAQQIEKSGADGWSWTDSFAFVDELAQTPTLVKSGSQILAELKDLTQEERFELNAYVKEEFDIADEKLESIVEDSLAIAFSAVSLIQKFK